MTIDPMEVDDDQGLEEVLNPNLRQEIKDARKTRRDLAKAQAELDAIRSEQVFAEAGVPDTGAGKWFRKGYEGPKEVEAVKAAAIADGIIAAPAADLQQQAEREAELEQQRRMAGAVREGGEPPSDAVVQLQQGIHATKSRDELLAMLNEAQRSGVPGVRIAVQGEEH